MLGRGGRTRRGDARPRSTRRRRGRGRGSAAAGAARSRSRDLARRQRRTTSRSRCTPGEILGIAALEGQGQDELFAVARRRARAPTAARSSSAGRPFRPRHPYDAIRAGVVLVPGRPAARAAAAAPDSREPRGAALQPHPRAGGRSTCARSAGACASAIDALQIDTRAAAAGAPALRRQPAEGDDRPLARARASTRCSASTRRAASTSARSARSTRCCASSPTTAPRSSSSRAS